MRLDGCVYEYMYCTHYMTSPQSVFVCSTLSSRTVLSGVGELTSGYSADPTKTIPAPAPSSKFHPFPNHQTLKQRLRALRVVRTRFVTDVTRCGVSVSVLALVSKLGGGEGRATHGCELVDA